MTLSRSIYRSLKLLGLATAVIHIAERIAVYRVGGHRDPTALHDFSRPVGEASTIMCEDGTELATVTIGEGRPILLAHGYTSNLANWALIAPELASRGFQVVMFDQRGHGQSSLGKDGFGINQLGSDLFEVLRHHDLTDATVVGHSMGGIGLQSYLLNHKEEAAKRVAKVVMLSTLPRNTDQSSRTARRISIIKSPWFERARKNRLHGLYFSSKVFGPAPAMSQVEAALELGLDCTQSTMHDALLPLLNFDFVDRLDEITQPTIVICGTEDKVTLPASSQLLADRIIDADLHWIDGVGHVTPYEEYEQVVELIVAHAKG